MKRNMNKLVTALLTIAILLTTTVAASNVDTFNSLSFTAEKNTAATQMLNGQNENGTVLQPNTTEPLETASFELVGSNGQKKVANLILPVGNTYYDIEVQGILDPVRYNTKLGYMGLFTGWIDSETPVYMYVIYASPTESAMIITVGYISDDTMPELYVFGELTETLGDISENYLARESENEQNEPTDSGIVPMSDYSLKYCGCVSIKKNNYTLGSLGVFSAYTMANGNVTPVYAKMVTDTDAARNYIVNQLGYSDSLLGDVRVTRAEFSIASNKADCYLVANSYKPTEESNTITMDIPYVWEGGFGTIPLISLTYTLSSIEVDDTGKVNNAFLPNKITWDIVDNSGMDPNDTDGTQTVNSSSASGLSAYSNFIYNGNVTSPTTVQFTIEGGLSYSGDYVFPNGTFPAGFPIEPTTIRNSITVLP